MPADSATLLTAERLEIGYRGRAILPPFDLTIQRGQFWAVIGRNGCGKSTLLKTLLGLHEPVAGRVVHGTPDLRFSYLPQRQVLDELYPLLARDVVTMGCERGLSFLRRRPSSAAREVETALEQMGIAQLADRPFFNLSEGQKQRVLFARLAASACDIALLDEPTSAMDHLAEREAFMLLDELRRSRGMTIMVVSHYLRLAREFADRGLVLDRDAPSVASGDPDSVFRSAAISQPPGPNGDAHRNNEHA